MALRAPGSLVRSCGDLGSRAMLRLVREWVDVHATELQEDWGLARAGRELKKIAPLE